MSIEKKLIDFICRKDFMGCLLEMTRQGLAPAHDALPLERGQRIWVQSSQDRWLCGEVDISAPHYLRLNKASWIDNTGEYWSVALKDKGAEADGWASEYIGQVMIPTSVVGEVLGMGPGAKLPTESIRVRRGD